MHQLTRGITRGTGEAALPLMCQVAQTRNVCSEEKVGTGFGSGGNPLPHTANRDLALRVSENQEERKPINIYDVAL